MAEEEIDRRLHRHMAAMAGLENTIAERARRQLSGGIAGPDVTELLKQLLDEAGRRRDSMSARLAKVAPGESVPDPSTAPAAIEELYDSVAHPASGALLGMHALLSQAVAGYAVVMELAFRAADSVELLGPENTGDLAWEHLVACTSEVQRIGRSLPYVIAAELEEKGSECRCVCPMCGLGVCGCPLAFRRRLDWARSEAGGVEEWPGLTLVTPRRGSPADQAGLRKGDVLLVVDGAEIDSLPMVQEAIKSHAAGDPVEFEVRDPLGDTRMVKVVRA